MSTTHRHGHAIARNIAWALISLALHAGCDTGAPEDPLGCEELCDPHATCSLQDGTIACACNPGYEGDGLVCEDIDECAEASPCGDGVCINNPGGYGCQCDPGYEDNGVTCVPVVFTIVGDGTPGSPRTWSDGFVAESCRGYRFPEAPYAYEGDTGDGIYTVQSQAGAVDVYCDMTTDGGGWTRLLHWDRISDPETHTLKSLLGQVVDEIAEAANPEVTPMGDLTELEDGLRWSDKDLTRDALSYRRDIDVANGGELRVNVHYAGTSMEASGVWLYAVSGDEVRDILCWSDAEDNENYSADELALIPYDCPDNDDDDGDEEEDGDDDDDIFWDTEERRMWDGITSVHLRSLHADEDLGDYSILHRLSVYVR